MHRYLRIKQYNIRKFASSITKRGVFNNYFKKYENYMYLQ